MKHKLLIISISILLLSCKNEQISEQSSSESKEMNIISLTNQQYKNAGIQVQPLSKVNISSLLKVNGKIDVPPQSMVSISVPLGGYLKSTKLLAGMHVNKGEVLAVMEDAQYIQLQQDYLISKSQLILAEGEYNRQKDLNQSKATSDKIFEQAKATYQTQLVLVKSFEEKLKLIGLNPQKLSTDNISNSINIYSPINGFVSAVNVNIGKYINSSDVLFELVNPSDIHLTLSVFEKDINNLSIGQKLFAYTNRNPDKKYNCEIILISKSLSSQSAAEVHCHFNQYDNTLLPGMFMNAEIETNSNNVSALPSDAIVGYDNKQYVFVAKQNNVFEMIEVQAGNTENDYTEILNAASLVNYKFVTKGAYNVLMALKNRSDE